MKYALMVTMCLCVHSSFLLSQTDSYTKNDQKKISLIRDIEADIDFAPVDDKVAMLKLIAQSSKSNYDKIKSWSGKYIFQDRSPYSKKYAEKLNANLSPNSFILTKGEFDFIFKNNPSKLFVDFQPLSSKLETMDDSANNVQLEFLRTLSIVTPESYMHFKPEVQYGVISSFQNIEQKHGKIVFIEQTIKADAEREASIPNPSYFFKIGPRFLWEEAEMFIEALKVEDQIKKNGHVFSVDVYEDTNKQSIFMIVLTTNNNIDAVTRKIIIDGKSGFNMVKFYDRITHGDVTHTHVISSFEYLFSDDVFLPSAISLNYPNQNGIGTRFVRHMQLVDFKLNISLSDDEFTHKKFGLSDGERLCDNIKNKLYFYKNGNLVESLTTSYGNNNTSFFFFRIVMIVVGIALIVLGLIKKISKTRSTPK